MTSPRKRRANHDQENTPTRTPTTPASILSLTSFRIDEALTWSIMRAVSGETVIEISFSLRRSGSEKHRVLPLPVPTSRTTSLPHNMAAAASSNWGHYWIRGINSEKRVEKCIKQWTWSPLQAYIVRSVASMNVEAHTGVGISILGHCSELEIIVGSVMVKPYQTLW